MAKSSAQGGKGSGETIQIVILTLFMTGGGFALISLVLSLFLIPARADDLERQMQDEKSLSELLARKNNAKNRMWDLRSRARDAEKAVGSTSLRERVESQLGPLQSNVTNFPKVNEHLIGGKTMEHSQGIDLKDARLQDVFDFVARVKQNNPSVHVGSVKVTRSTRGSGSGAAGGGADDDKWQVNLVFYLYTTSSGPGGPGKAAAAAEASEEAAPEAGGEETPSEK